MFHDDEGAQFSDENWSAAREKRVARDNLTDTIGVEPLAHTVRLALCTLCEDRQWESNLYWLDDLPFCTKQHRTVYQEIMHERARAQRS